MPKRIIKLRSLLTGLSSFVPGLYGALYKATGAGGGLTQSAEYCHLTWLTMMAVAESAGLSTVPESIVELGPGLSLGSGISAVLSGAKEYHALDAISYSESSTNIRLVRELSALLLEKSGIPLDRPYPELKSSLPEDGFPQLLEGNIDFEKLKSSKFIDFIVQGLGSIGTANENTFFYHAPWDNLEVFEKESKDFIFSKAVLEHVEDINFVHKATYGWLKNGGHVVHKIDFASHGTSNLWNGHWAINDFTWSLIRGKRPYSINRNFLKEHLDSMKKVGFTILKILPQLRSDGIGSEQLSERFRLIDKESLLTRQAFIVAIKD